VNRDPATIFLATLLVLGAAVTTGLCYWHQQVLFRQQQVQAQIAGINKNRALMQSLAGDCAEYAKSNPAMLPLLEKLGLRVRKEAPKVPGTPQSNP